MSLEASSQSIKTWPDTLTFQVLVPWTFFMIGMFGYVLRATDFFAAVPGDLGDARFNSVILEHVFQWITGHEKSLWSPTYFFPFESVLAFSDNHFGSSLPYILLRFAGLGREAAFDGWFLVGNCLNFLAVYFVLRRIGFLRFGSAAGAFVFAFALPVEAQEGHAQLVYRFAIPLAYSAFWELLSTKRMYVLWRVFFWGAIQFYCSIYLGIFLIYLLVATIVARFVLRRNGGLVSSFLNSIRGESRAATLFYSGTSALCACSVYWLLHKYHSVSVDYGFVRSREEIKTMLPRLSSYLFSDRSLLSSWPGRLIKGIPMRHEHQLFFGFGVWAIGAYGVVMAWRGRDQHLLGQTAALSLAFLFFATLSVGGVSAYLLLTYIPGLNAIRAVSRVVVVMLLPVALLVALGSDQLLRGARAGASKQIIVVIGMVLLLTAEVVFYHQYNVPTSLWLARNMALRAQLPSQLPANPIIFVTKKETELFYFAELDAMILAQDLGVPTLNGYSGNLPPGWMQADPCVSYLNRLDGYAVHRHLSLSSMNEIAKRVVVISPNPCEFDPAVPFEGKVSADQVKQIKISIINAKVAEGRFNVQINILNNSAVYFNTVSTSGNHVRLSWRFVPARHVEGNLPGWDSRKDLVWSLPSGEGRKVDLSVVPPQQPGVYFFEVSLVQEGVAWFHDLGMSIARVPITIGVTVGEARQEKKR